MELEEALERSRELYGAATGRSIGTLGEKTLHAALKCWVDAEESHWEISLPQGYVADVFDGERVTEIQTAGFSAMRPKLERLLEQYPVTLVHPLVRRKWLCWVNPDSGEVSGERLSPRRGSFSDGARELVYLLPCLKNSRLTVRLVLLDVEEHRLADGWGADGKRGSHRLERYPRLERSCPPEVLELTAPADYEALLPAALPEAFTAAELEKATRLHGRRLSGLVKILLEMEVVTREKDGRCYVYRRRPGENQGPRSAE